MIYQLDNDFKFYPYVATYHYNNEEVKSYLVSKDEFETRFLEKIKSDKEIKDMQKWYSNNPNIPYEPKGINNVILPDIHYAEVMHTKEEEDRLSRCNKCHGSLDDIKYYVKTGKYPQKDHSLKALEIEDLKDENVQLKVGQAELLEQSVKNRLEISLTIAQLMEQNI